MGRRNTITKGQFLKILAGTVLLLSGIIVPKSYSGPAMKQLQRGIAGTSIATPSYASGTQASGTTNYGLTATASLTPSSPSSTSMVIAFAYCNQANTNFSGMTYDGNAMTIVGSQVDNAADTKHAVMYRYNGSLGSGAKNIVVTVDTNASINITAIQIDGVKTSNPIHTTNSAVDESSTPSQVTVSDTTTQNNCLIVCGDAASSSTTGDISVCSGTGQTLLTESEESGSSIINISHMDKDSAGAVSQCFEFSVDAKLQIAILAAINPDGA